MEKCTLEQHGFLGFYYPGTVQTHKAVISVGGAGCNEKASIAMAQYLIDAGYNVLVLGFYLWKGLSKNLASVPVDYCEKAVHWLMDEKKNRKGGHDGYLYRRRIYAGVRLPDPGDHLSDPGGAI